MTHSLYRFYDARGRLLYVGITGNLPGRWHSHASTKAWWRDVASATVEHFGSRTDLEAAEKAAIIAERPVHNVVHNRDRMRRHREVARRDAKSNLWTFRSAAGYERERPLELYWEVSGDPISDDFLPEEIDASELLHMWNRRYGKNSDVSIHWFVIGPGIIESAPVANWRDDDGFLANFTWPVNAATGEPLNWMSLPVVDKFWMPGRGDKGGFIQQATGWKPAPFMTSVNAAMLMGGLPSRAVTR